MGFNLKIHLGGALRSSSFCLVPFICLYTCGPFAWNSLPLCLLSCCAKHYSSSVRAQQSRPLKSLF